MNETSDGQVQVQSPKPKEKNTFTYYPSFYLKVNGLYFTGLEISDHYQRRPGREGITHDVIKELVRVLDDKWFRLEDEEDNWQYLKAEPIVYQGKNYKLVWCWPVGGSALRVRTCHRTRKKYEDWEYIN